MPYSDTSPIPIHVSSQSGMQVEHHLGHLHIWPSKSLMGYGLTLWSDHFLKEDLVSEG